MAADVSSVARLLRGEAAGKRAAPSEIVTMDLLGGCGGGGAAAAAAGDDEVDVDLEVKVPAGWERRLDLLSGKTFLTPRHQGGGADRHQDLNLPPPAAAAAASSAAVCTLDMVRSALERANAGRTAAASPATSSSSSKSTSSSSSSSSAAAVPSMRAAACPSCLTYVLITEADPRCPRCAARVPPPAAKPGVASAANGGGKKRRLDLNAAADENDV